MLGIRQNVEHSLLMEPAHNLAVLFVPKMGEQLTHLAGFNDPENRNQLHHNGEFGTPVPTYKGHELSLLM